MMKEYDRTFTENEVMAIIAAADDKSALDLGYMTFAFSANAEMFSHYCTLSAVDSEDLTLQVIICVDTHSADFAGLLFENTETGEEENIIPDVDFTKMQNPLYKAICEHLAFMAMSEFYD